MERLVSIPRETGGFSGYGRVEVHSPDPGAEPHLVHHGVDRRESQVVAVKRLPTTEALVLLEVV